MKIKFEANLQYQKDAINSVVKLFEGAPYVRREDRISQEVSHNILKISQEKIFENYDNIVRENQIDEEKQYRNEELLDFTVEMETGTGKTYIYLRTILELYKQYGLTKFVIVVPSIAVKEGVVKTLNMTKDHFNEIYNEKIDFFEYDSRKTTRVRHFAYSNTLQVMVINVQAFNADDNIINQERDVNNGEKLIDLIKAVRPVVIMDEPQEGMDSENMEKRFLALNPLLKIRYSATHKNPINLVYRLTPYEAYNQGLVKKIEVYSIHEENTQSNVEVEFKEIKLTSAKPQAKLELKYKSGTDFKTKEGYFKELDDLEEKTNNPVYKGWIVERVYKDLMDGVEKVKFSNGVELTKGSKHGWDKESIFREQIRWTIKRHFKKKEEYKQLGIKVLSLFFIDRVANYVQEDGLIRKLFVELYKEEYQKEYGKEPNNIEQVHGGYFAKTTTGEYTDNINSIKKNKDIYNLIMKDKERLLSFEEPLEFIFSHSALGVGWDNPNVFQICTLNESHSEIKKRQEIGRGLRICVDKSGERYRDADTVVEGEEVNLLTVIPNESYQAFVTQYQEEIVAETGDRRETKVRNARKGANKININEDILDSEDFKNLWKKIQKKTRYMVSFREQELIEKCVDELNSIVVKEQIIQTQAVQIRGLSETEDIKENILSKGETTTTAKSPIVHIDLIDQISEQTSLSVRTVIDVLNQVSNQEMIARNPVVYLAEAVKRIKRVLNKEMVRVITYQPTNEEFSIEDFKIFDPQTYNDVVPTRKGVYDAVEYDSTVEKDFVLEIDQENKVKAFVKLPRWYKIDTPIGSYNPDFALVLEKKDLEKGGETKYYFVVETKGTDDINELREEERMKIECAIKHFEAIGFEKYVAPVKSFSSFSTKININ